MVRYYCDRCNAEVEGPDDMIEIAIEGRERPNLALWSSRAEMCRACFDQVKDQIAAALGAADEAKRKPVRRAAS